MKRHIVFLTALVISLFAMAQDFKPMEHNGLLYQELAFRMSEMMTALNASSMLRP